MARPQICHTHLHIVGIIHVYWRAFSCLHVLESRYPRNCIFKVKVGILWEVDCVNSRAYIGWKLTRENTLKLSYLTVWETTYFLAWPSIAIAHRSSASVQSPSKSFGCGHELRRFLVPGSFCLWTSTSLNTTDVPPPSVCITSPC